MPSVLSVAGMIDDEWFVARAKQTHSRRAVVVTHFAIHSRRLFSANPQARDS